LPKNWKYDFLAANRELIAQLPPTHQAAENPESAKTASATNSLLLT